MAQYINKQDALAEIDRMLDSWHPTEIVGGRYALNKLRGYLDTLEVKEVDLIIHTIIAECCDWIAMNTNLSHDEIEGCRNLMLAVKEEQFKHRKEE